MLDIAELIARLEKATEGNHALDYDIEMLVKGPATGPRWSYDYTSSVDAALTLFEDGAEFSITTVYGAVTVDYPINRSDGVRFAEQRRDGNIPLAICTVALKARAAEG